MSTKVPIVIFCGPAGSGKDTAAQFLAKNHGAVLLAQADPMKRFARDLYGFTDQALWGPSEEREKPFPITTLGRQENEDLMLRWVGQELGIREVDKAVFRLKSWNEGTLHEAEQNLITGFISARKVLQTLGTEWGRNLSPALWVEAAVHIAERLLEGGYAYTREGGPKAEAGARPAPFVAIADGRFANEVLTVRRHGGIAVRILGRRGGVTNAGHRSETELEVIPGHFYDATIHNVGTLAELEMAVNSIVTKFFSPFVTMGSATGTAAAEVARALGSGTKQVAS